MKRIATITTGCAGAVLIAALAAAAAPQRATAPASPKPHEYSYGYDVINHSVVRPATRLFDVARVARTVSRHPREAVNVDANDQVRLPSTWWQPRIGFRTVTVEQMLKGPGSGTGPAHGRWTVTKAKTQGVTPGFQVEDSKGDNFIIKFDSPETRELATGADVVGSYVFWAAGYNVPENTIAYFRPEDLDISPKATYTDTHGHKLPFTKAHLGALLASVAGERDGSYRCLASRYLPGKPLGPFQYFGRRSDDPEDLVPHELRRELRGLWTVAAWLNHVDCRGPNSLDMWVTDGGRSFVRHNLIDFGSIMGSNATAQKRELATGSEYYLDYGATVRKLPTLGLVEQKWEDAVDPQIPSVGVFESKVFDGASWRPDIPNPAFDERTVRDIRWGARIVAGFTNDHIRAVVAAAHYTDPRAAEYLTRVLIERRDKLVSRWLGPSPAALTSAQ